MTAKPNPFRVILALLALAVTPLILTAWIGAPIPRDWPTAEQVETLLRGLTANHLHAGLRIIVWAAWLAVLVGSIWEIASYLSHRDPSTVPARRPWFLRLTGALALGTTATTAMTGATTTAAMAEDTRFDSDNDNAPSPEATPTEPVSASTTTATKTSDISPDDSPEHEAVHTVRIGDTLWDVADAELGDGDKWATIYQHNKDQPQADGGTLTDPDLIRPGWELSIPHGSDKPTEDEPSDSDTDSGGGEEPQHSGPSDLGPGGDFGDQNPDALPPLGEGNPDAATAPADEASSDSAAWDEPVVLGIAGIVAAGLVTGVVRIAKAAHRRVTDYEHRTGRRGPDITIDADIEDAASSVDDVGTDAPPAFAVDEHDEPVAITAIATGGLGVTGPGAEAAARAAIATCLASGPDIHDSPHAMVLTTRGVLDALAGPALIEAWPSYRLHAAEDNTSLMRRLSRELLARHRSTDDEQIPMMVVTTCDGEAARELSSLLDQAADLQVYGINVGDWPQRTIHIEADGSADTDTHGTIRCHHLNEISFSDILDTLAAAEETLDEPITAPSAETDFVDDTELLPHTTHPNTEGDDTTPPASTNAPLSSDVPPPDDPESTVEASRATPTPEPAPSADPHPNTTAQPPLRLQLLGDAELHHDGKPVLIRRARGRELLARLALDPRGVGLDELLEVVCGDIKRTNARHHFQSILTQTRTDLRQHTGEPTSTMFILYTKQRYRLDPDWFSSDIDDFAGHLATASTTPDPETRASLLQAAIDLYGEFAAGLDSDGIWTLPVRAKFADEAAAACLHLAEHHGSTTVAITLLDKATAITPYQEDVYAALIRAHLDNDDLESAAKIYNRLRTRLSKINRSPSATVRNIMKEDDVIGQ